jgi:hypothetical protein
MAQRERYNNRICVEQKREDGPPIMTIMYVSSNQRDRILKVMFENRTKRTTAENEYTNKVVGRE